MSEGTDASISAISTFGMSTTGMLAEFTAGITDAVESIGKVVLGASGITEGVTTAGVHATLVESSGMLIGDVVKGVSSLGAGAVTIATNYADADARQQSEMTTVWNAFYPDGGPTVAGQMAQARSTADSGESYGQRLRTTGDGTLPEPTTTGPAARTAAQKAMDEVQADREEYGQDEHQNWVFGRDDLVETPEPETPAQPQGYNPYGGGYHLGG